MDNTSFLDRSYRVKVKAEVKAKHALSEVEGLKGKRTPFLSLNLRLRLNVPSKLRMKCQNKKIKKL